MFLLEGGGGGGGGVAVILPFAIPNTYKFPIIS